MHSGGLEELVFQTACRLAERLFRCRQSRGSCPKRQVKAKIPSHHCAYLRVKKPLIVDIHELFDVLNIPMASIRRGINNKLHQSEPGPPRLP